MGNGKQKIKRQEATKIWKILSGTYRKKHKILKKNVERLIAAVQQECEWDETDIKTWDAIQEGKIDWSGNVRSKRRTRKHIRKRS
jgi:hypothetical protein